MPRHPDPITRLVTILLSAVMVSTAIFPWAPSACGACHDHADHADHADHDHADHDHADHDREHEHDHDHDPCADRHRVQQRPGIDPAPTDAPHATPKADPQTIRSVSAIHGADGCLCSLHSRPCAAPAAMAIARAPAGAHDRTDAANAGQPDHAAHARTAPAMGDAHAARARAILHDPGPPCPGGSVRARSLRATRLVI